MSSPANGTSNQIRVCSRGRSTSRGFSDWHPLIGYVREMRVWAGRAHGRP